MPGDQQNISFLASILLIWGTKIRYRQWVCVLFCTWASDFKHYCDWLPTETLWKKTMHACYASLCVRGLSFVNQLENSKCLGEIGLCSVLRPHQHSIGHMGDGFYRSKDPTNSIKVLKEDLQRKKHKQRREHDTHKNTK